MLIKIILFIIVFAAFITEANAVNETCIIKLKGLESTQLSKASGYINYLVKRGYLTKSTLDKLVSSIEPLSIDDFEWRGVNEVQKISLSHGLVAALNLISTEQQWNEVVGGIKKEVSAIAAAKVRVEVAKSDTKPIWIAPVEIDLKALGIKQMSYRGSAIRASGPHTEKLPFIFATPDGFFNTKTKSIIPSYDLEAHRTTIVRYPNIDSDDFAVMGVTRSSPFRFKIINSSGKILTDLEIKKNTLNEMDSSPTFFESELKTFRHGVFAAYDEGGHLKLIIKSTDAQSRNGLNVDLEKNKFEFIDIPTDNNFDENSEIKKVTSTGLNLAMMGLVKFPVSINNEIFKVVVFYDRAGARDIIEIYDAAKKQMVSGINWHDVLRNIVGISSVGASVIDNQRFIHIVSKDTNTSTSITKINIDTKKAETVTGKFMDSHAEDSRVIIMENSDPIIFGISDKAIHVYNPFLNKVFTKPHHFGANNLEIQGYSSSRSDVLVYLNEKSRGANLIIYNIFGTAP